jgi:hypothetical protein
MNIVPTSTPKKQEIDLDFLATRKAEIRDQIQDQRQQIVASTHNLLSPASFSTYIFKGFSKGLNMVDGVIIGFKMMKTIRKFFRR